jgi:hypothetical protein
MFKFVRTFIVITLFLLPLTGFCQIDVPKWVDDIGGPNANCISSAVKVDKQNNVYVTGFYNGTVDFDPSGGVYNLTSVNGSFDTYIAEYTSDGKLIWAVSIGGSGTDQVNSIAIDADGNPSVSGQYNSSDFDADPGAGTFILPAPSDNYAFVVKLNTNGAFMWAKSLGGNGNNLGGHISTDSKENVIETMRYEGTVTVGNQTYTSLSGTSNFNGLTIKFDPNGNLLWAINITDNDHSECDFSGVDNQDNVIIAGYFEGNDNFNPLGTAVNFNGNGSSAYLAKYSPSGNLIWVKSFTDKWLTII